jgi:multidrug efflux pump
MSHFFIDRPVFAWVIAILITIAGGFAVFRLPTGAYPDIAPPQVAISASYPGADAEAIERAVTQVIEQQLTGIDNVLYFTSSSSSDGAASITLTFETGTDPDVAVVQTQNKVALATPRLPQEVIQQGLVVAKQNSDFLMAVSIRSPDNSVSSPELQNIVAAQLLDSIQRIRGVGGIRQFGSPYAMRIWLNPDALRSYRISASDVLARIRGQNVQFATGSLGARPAVEGQQITAQVSAEGRFTSVAEFGNVILRTEANGTSIRLRDVAKIELAPSNFASEARFNGQPVAGFGVLLQPGANALEVADAVKTRMDELSSSLPVGVEWFVPFDSTKFILTAIEEVIMTLCIAIVLVFIVMLVFLQSFRATIIPTLVVPVALMGAMIGMYFFDFSINQLTLFGMVLAIGIVVDDAIVVIESVERIMREEHLAPREATRKAMDQITNPIIAISIVLAAVFVPSALMSGSTGVIYRQFGVTIAVSMGFSAFLALSLTPALCATLLRPEHMKENRIFRWFNHGYDRTQATYLRTVKYSLRHQRFWFAGFAVLLLGGGLLFWRVPSSFVPDEDQGFALGLVQLPPGSTMTRTQDYMAKVSEQIRQHDAVDGVFAVSGFSFMGVGENMGLFFIRLKDWGDRDATASEFAGWAIGAVNGAQRDGFTFFLNLPTIRGLGAFGGFDFWLEDRAGVGRGALYGAMGQLLQEAGQSKVLAQVRPSEQAPGPQLKLKLDREQAQSMGLSVTDVYNTVQLMLAPVYVNDFFYEGRVLRVMMQADAPFRMNEDAFSRFYLPAGNTTSQYAFTGGDVVNDNMVPLSSVLKGTWQVGPPSIARYNGYAAVNINGGAAPGFSSGEAMDEIARLTEEKLPKDFGYAWATQSFQEQLAGAEAPMLFGLSFLVVFLCLAALYESWATPLAVMLVVPVGLIGSILAAWLTGLPNDVFFKVGIITIIGLAAKNAILIVEFALEAQKAGQTLYNSVVEAARLRLRPILMTSFAFILGVIPLVVATGAGANARRAIGTGVAGGMLTAALLGVLLAPVFYVVIRRMAGDPFALEDGASERDKLNG